MTDSEKNTLEQLWILFSNIPGKYHENPKKMKQISVLPNIFTIDFTNSLKSPQYFFNQYILYTSTSAIQSAINL